MRKENNGKKKTWKIIVVILLLLVTSPIWIVGLGYFLKFLAFLLLSLIVGLLLIIG